MKQWLTYGTLFYLAVTGTICPCEASSQAKQGKVKPQASGKAASGQAGGKPALPPPGGSAASGTANQVAVFPVFPTELLDPALAVVLARTAQQPELLNPEYLKYYLGPPDNKVSKLNNQSNVYYWYDKLRNPRVELYSERDQLSGNEADVLVMHLPQSDLDLQKVASALGHGGKRFFDANGHPASMYSFAPATSVTFVSPQNSFAVRKSLVMYKGPMLASPSAESLQTAQDDFVTNLSRTSAKGKWSEAISLLRQRVHDQPLNAEAHLALAGALSKAGHAHDAVSEYKHAMSLEPGNDTLKRQCLEGLHRLHSHVVTDTANGKSVAARPESDSGSGKAANPASQSPPTLNAEPF